MSPLLMLMIVAVLVGITGTFFVVVTVSVRTWQTHTWSNSVLTAYPSNDNTADLQVQSPNDTVGGFYTVLEKTTTTTNGTISTSYTTYYLFAETAGLWQICDDMSDAARTEYAALLGSTKDACYVFVTEFEEESSTLPETAKRIARMHNSAGCCFIVTAFDLLAAGVVAIFSVSQRQVSAAMVAGVFYAMAALFTIFGLAIFHTKVYYERYSCDSFRSFPSELCSAKESSILWPVVFGWVGVFVTAMAAFLWLFFSRSLRVIKAKTML